MEWLRMRTLIVIAFMPVSFAGCAELIREGVRAGVRAANDPGPPATIPMIPLGPPSAATLEEQQTQADSTLCESFGRTRGAETFGSQATRAKLATQNYVLCMASRGYRCVDRSEHKTCEAAWTHPTANRGQWREDMRECIRAAFWVILASNRHARVIECMASRGYRADVGEPTGEAAPPPSTADDRGPTATPPVAAEPVPGATGTVTAATPATSPMAPGALNWPPVGASYVQSVRMSSSFGSGTETQTIRYLGEQTWQGSTVRAFSSGSITTYVDARRRVLARVNSSTGTPIESFEPYFIQADWPLRVGKWWPNRYRYSDHEWGRSSNDVRYDGEVAAQENVKTPAGTFRSFRIVLGGGGSSKHVLWYSGELGLVVKTRTERFSNHYRGPGVRETEVISYDFRP